MWLFSIAFASFWSRATPFHVLKYLTVVWLWDKYSIIFILKFDFALCFEAIPWSRLFHVKYRFFDLYWFHSDVAKRSWCTIAFQCAPRFLPWDCSSFIVMKIWSELDILLTQLENLLENKSFNFLRGELLYFCFCALLFVLCQPFAYLWVYVPFLTILILVGCTLSLLASHSYMYLITVFCFSLHIKHSE